MTKALTASVSFLRWASRPLAAKPRHRSDYLTVEAKDEITAYGKKKIDRWNIAVGYDYNLSKRTSVYTAASYIKESMKNWEERDRDPSSIEVMAA